MDFGVAHHGHVSPGFILATLSLVPYPLLLLRFNCHGFTIVLSYEYGKTMVKDWRNYGKTNNRYQTCINLKGYFKWPHKMIFSGDGRLNP